MNVAIPNSDSEQTKNDAWIAFFKENNNNLIGGNLFAFFREHLHDDILSLLSKEFLKEGEIFEFKNIPIFENIEKYVLNYLFITFCEQQFNETNTLVILRLCTFLQQTPKILVSVCTKLGINESMDFSQVTLEILDKKTLETADEWDEKEWEKNSSRSSFATTRASMSATSRQSYYPTHEYARMSFYDSALESDRESEWGGEPETGLIDNIPRRKIVQDRVNTLAEKTRAEIEQLDAQAKKLNASKAKDQKKYQEYQTKREAIVAKATLESKELLHEKLRLMSETVFDVVADKPREKKDRDDEKNEGFLRQDNILNHQKTTKKRAYTGKIRIYNANAEFLKSTWVLYKFSNAEKQRDFIFTQAEQIHPEHLLQFIRNNKTYFNALPLKNRNTILILLFNYFKSAFISIHSTHDLLVLDSPIETPNVHQNFTSGYIAVKEKNSIKLYHKMNLTIVHLETTSENEIQKNTNALLTQIIENPLKNSKDFRVIQLSDENLIQIKRLHNYSSNTMEKNFDSAAKGSLFETIEINEEQNTTKTFFGTIVFGEQGTKEASISDTVINNLLAFSQSISLHDFYLLLNEINQTKDAVHANYATLPFEYTLSPMSEISSQAEAQAGIIYLAFDADFDKNDKIWYRTSQTEIAKSLSLDWLLKLYSNEPTKEGELFQLSEAFTHKDLNKLSIFISDILNKILSISPEDISPIETKKQLLESIAPKLLPTGHFSLDLQEYRDAYSIFEAFYSHPTCTPEEKHIIRQELSKCFHAILVKWEEITPEKWASNKIIDLEAEEETALNAQTAFTEIFNNAMLNSEQKATTDPAIQEELKQTVYQHLRLQRKLKIDFEHYVEQFKQVLVVFHTCYSNSAFTENDQKLLEKEYVDYFLSVLIEWSRTDLPTEVPLEIVTAVSINAINNQSAIQQAIKDALYAYILESSHLLSTTNFADYYNRYNAIDRIFDYIDKDKNYENKQTANVYQQYTSTLKEKFNETFKLWAEGQVSNPDFTHFLELISDEAENNKLIKKEFQLIILNTFSTFRRDKKIELLKNICCDDKLYIALTSTTIFSMMDVNISEQSTPELKELGSCDLSQALVLLSHYKGNSTKSLMEDNEIIDIAVDLEEFKVTFIHYLKEYKKSYMSESDTRQSLKENLCSDSVDSEELSDIGNLLIMFEIADILGIDSKTVLLAIEAYYKSLEKICKKEFLVQVNEDSILCLALACISSSTILDSKSTEVFPFIEKLYTFDKPDRTFLNALQIISKDHRVEGSLSFKLLNYHSTSKLAGVRMLTYFGWRTPKAAKEANRSSSEELNASSGELNLLCTPHNESPSSSRDDLSVVTHDQFRTPDRADSTPTVYTPSTTSQRIDAFTPPITPHWDETRNSLHTLPRDTNNTPLTTPQRTETPARTLPVPKILSAQFNLINQQLEAKQKADLQGKLSTPKKITSIQSLDSFGNSPPGSPIVAAYSPARLMAQLSGRKNDVIPTTRQEDVVSNEIKGMKSS